MTQDTDKFVQNLIKSVRPGGQIIFVEYRANDRKVPIKPPHTMTVDQVRKEAEDIGLRFDRTDSSLPWQHMIFFERLMLPQNSDCPPEKELNCHG